MQPLSLASIHPSPMNHALANTNRNSVADRHGLPLPNSFPQRSLATMKGGASVVVLVVALVLCLGGVAHAQQVPASCVRRLVDGAMSD